MNVSTRYTRKRYTKTGFLMAGFAKKLFLKIKASNNKGTVRIKARRISNLKPSVHAFRMAPLSVTVVLKKNKKKTRRKTTMKRYRNKAWIITYRIYLGILFHKYFM